MNNADHDPVEEFFNRERGQIVSQDANDMHWQVILRQARVQRRSRFLGYVAGAAAAALFIGGVTYGAVLRNDPPNLIAATNGRATASPSDSGPITMAQQTPAPSASTALTAPTPVPVPVPKSFAPLSVSNVGGGNLFVLGSISCAAGRCPVLIGSTDNGRSWHLVSSLKNNSSSVHDQSTAMAANEVTQVRFANAKVGWAYGPDLQYTTDGGRTFRPYGHLGQNVVDVETDGSQVIVTSVDACAKSKCSGTSHVAHASISASGANTEVGTGAALGDDLSVEFDGKQPYVATGGSAPQRITAGGLVPLGKLGDTCGGVIGRRVIATADPQGGLFAFCPAVGGGAAGSIGLSVLSSKDQGRSWAPVSSGALVMGINSPRSFAAANARDLLAVSGGSHTEAGRGSMRVSHDGGKTWRDPGAPPPMPPNGWAWVGAPGGTTFYAISADALPAFWKSDDSGETWTKVGLTP